MVWRVETAGALRNFGTDTGSFTGRRLAEFHKVGDEISMVVPKKVARKMRRIARAEHLHNFMYMGKEGDFYKNEEGKDLPIPEGHRRVRLGLHKITDLSGFKTKLIDAYENMGMELPLLPF